MNLVKASLALALLMTLGNDIKCVCGFTACKTVTICSSWQKIGPA